MGPENAGRAPRRSTCRFAALNHGNENVVCTMVVSGARGTRRRAYVAPPSFLRRQRASKPDREEPTWGDVRIDRIPSCDSPKTLRAASVKPSARS